MYFLQLADDISRIVYHTRYELFIFILKTYDEHSLKEIFVPDPNLLYRVWNINTEPRITRLS